MKKTLTLNLKDIKTVMQNFIETTLINRQKLILTVLSVFGIWCGTRLFIAGQETIRELISSCINEKSITDRAELIIIQMFINVLPILIAFTNGFFVLGTPIIMLNQCMAGVIIGIINAWTFSVYRLNGVLFSLISIIPFSLLITIMLIISSNESIKISKRIAKSIFNIDQNERGEVKEFLVKEAIITTISVALTILQTFIIKILFNRLLCI